MLSINQFIEFCDLESRPSIWLLVLRTLRMTSPFYWTFWEPSKIVNRTLGRVKVNHGRIEAGKSHHGRIDLIVYSVRCYKCFFWLFFALVAVNVFFFVEISQPASMLLCALSLNDCYNVKSWLFVRICHSDFDRRVWWDYVMLHGLVNAKYPS